MARRVSEAGPGHPILTEVYLGGQLDANAGQFLRLYNPSRAPVRLDGWSIGDGTSWATFPTGAMLPPGHSFYLARDPLAFTRAMGQPPDLIWGGTAGAENVPGANWMSGGEELQLAAGGGWIGLQNADEKVVDAVVWGAGRQPHEGGGAPVGDSTASSAPQGDPSWPGWQGEPIPLPKSGEILDRARTEGSILDGRALAYGPDTDSAADWKQGATWLDERAYRPGQTWFGAPQFEPDQVTVYSTPDSTYSVLTAAIDGAQRSIAMEIYDFSLVQLVERLAAAVKRGVQVRLLIEAGTVAGIYDPERWAAEQVATAGGEVRWILNDPKAGFPGRYIYDHSKWGVIDGRNVIVQSENWVRHGVAVDPSFGNRGWGALVEDPRFADYLTEVFEADWCLTFGDVQRFGVPPFGGPGPEFKPEAALLTGKYPAPFKALTVSGGIRLTPVLAPDHALLETGGIIGLLRSARSTLLIEQQYVHPHWGAADGDPVKTPDLYLKEAIQAARRGVRVRILLSDAFLNAKDPKDNTVTIAYVNETAQREGLDLTARLINSKAAGLDKIHNKGIVVDSTRVLISSINWSLNSPANNRELGIILEHPLIGRYFSDLFQYDWNAGQPAAGVLIGGVDRGAGRVVIQNHGAVAVELAGWALAAEGGRWALPAVTIPAGGTVRFGRGKAQLPRSFKLRPEGDRLRLLNGEQEVDAVEWGSTALYARAPLSAGTGALCRTDGPDTNTSLDWQADCEIPK